MKLSATRHDETNVDRYTFIFNIKYGKTKVFEWHFFGDNNNSLKKLF